MNQIAVLPLVSRHSRSAFPSPLKSRWPTIDQAVGTVPTLPDPDTWDPFMNQIAVLPLVSRQVMSLMLLPLKSWAASGTARPITIFTPSDAIPWPACVLSNQQKGIGSNLLGRLANAPGGCAAMWSL